MTVMAELKPFPVLNGKYLFYFTPADEGGFSVACQNIPGVNAQGDTFEEALANAVSMAAFVEECRRGPDIPKDGPLRAVNNKGAIIRSLCGILPSDVTKEEAREARLAKYEHSL